VARNTVLNLLGQGVPMMVALFAIPVLIKALGIDRFGVLTMVWLVMGYFSLFDLGLGRALTQIVSRNLGTNQTMEIPFLVWTSLPLMFLLGLVGALVMASLAPWAVGKALKIPGALQPETLNAFYVLALSLPIVISAPSLRGLLEAYHRFDLTNAVNCTMGSFMFMAPLAVLPFSKNLALIVAVLLLGRLIAWLANFLLVLHVIPTLRQGIKFKAALIRPLLQVGGWMTVTNIIGPLMVYLDRFLLGAFISVAAVTYYATPFELVTKLWLLPGALVGVLFPAISATFCGNQKRTAELFCRGVKFIFLALFPIVLAIVTLAPEGLTLWLGADFAQHSYRVLQLIAIGVFVNSLALVPFALVQGASRPDLTAKLHLVELPLYLLVLWALIKGFGLEGAALAWVLRVSLDASVLFYLARRTLSQKALPLFRTSATMAVALLTLTLAALLVGPLLKGVFLAAALIGFIFVSWFIILSPQERTQFQDRLQIRQALRRSS
jgi:O-antigen/teichoic acid export membrane protein